MFPKKLTAAQVKAIRKELRRHGIDARNTPEIVRLAKIFKLAILPASHKPRLPEFRQWLKLHGHHHVLLPHVVNPQTTPPRQLVTD